MFGPVEEFVFAKPDIAAGQGFAAFIEKTVPSFIGRRTGKDSLPIAVVNDQLVKNNIACHRWFVNIIESVIIGCESRRKINIPGAILYIH